MEIELAYEPLQSKEETIDDIFKTILVHIQQRTQNFSIRGQIQSILITLDDQFILLGQSSGLIHVYSAQQMNLAYTFQGHENKVNSLCNIPNQVFASASNDQHIMLWDLNDRVLKLDIPCPSDAATPVKNIVATNSFLASSGLQRAIRIWNFETGESLGVLEGHQQIVTNLCTSDQYLISTGLDKKIIIWYELQVYKVINHQTDVKSIVYVPVKGYLATISSDQLIRVWNLNGKQMGVLEGNEVKTLASTIDGEYLITGETNTQESGVIQVWNLENFTSEGWMTVQNPIKSLVTSFDGIFLYSAENQAINKIKLYEDTDQYQQVTRENLQVQHVCVSENGQELFYVCENRLLQYSLYSGESVLLKQEQGLIQALQTSNNYLAVGCQNTTIRVRSIVENREIAILTKHRQPIRNLYFSSQAQYLASADKNKVIVWDFNNYQDILLGESRSVIGDVCISKNTLAIFGNRKGIVIYSILYPQNPSITLNGFAQHIKSLELCHVNNQVIVCGANGFIDIWNLDFFTLEASLQYQCYNASLVNVHVSLFDTFLSLAFSDGYLQFWSLTDKTRLGAIAMKTKISDLKLNFQGDLMFACSGKRIIQIANPSYGCQASGHKMHILGPHQYSIVFLLYFKLLFQNKISDDYPKHLNQWVILPWTVNLLHLFAYQANLNFIKIAFKNGCQLLRASNKQTALSIAMRLRKKELVDTITGKLAKSAVNESFVLTRIQDELPQLNTFAPSALGTLYKVAFDISTQPDLKRFGIPKKKPTSTHPSVSYRIDHNNFLVNTDIEISTDKTETTTRVQEVKKGNQEYLVYRVSRFRFNFASGNQQGMEFLESLIDCDDPQVFRSPIIHAIIFHKWQQIEKLTIIHSVLYFFYILILILHSVFDEHQNHYLLWTLGVLNSMFMLMECFQMSVGFKSYFSDRWNFWDLVRIVNLYVYIVIEFLGYSYQSRILLSCCIFVSFLRGIAFFRIFNITRYFIRMLIQVTYDIIPFLIVVVFATFALTFFFLVIRSSQNERDDFIFTIKEVFLIDFGQYDYTGDYTQLEWIVFYIASMVSPLILFNLLIAIMTDTYNKVQQDMVVADLKEMISLILEYESIIFWRRQSGERMYMQLCTVGDEEDFEIQDIWEGRLNLIIKDVDSLNVKLNYLDKNTAGMIQGAKEMVEWSENQLQDRIEKLHQIGENFKNDMMHKLRDIEYQDN